MYTDNSIVVGILSGIVGWIYSAKLTDAGMILNWWYVFADQHLPKWIAKPVVTCFKCVSGQIGLWSFVYFSHQEYFTAGIIISPAIAILTSIILNKHYGD